MPRTYKPRDKLYTEASIQVAIEEVEAGASVRSTAKKYHLSVSMLRKRCLHSRGLITLCKQGRKQLIPLETEKKLASYIRRMADLGFGPAKQEMVEIVNDYLEANELSHLFKNKRPGDDWVQYFMKRHKLTLKKAGLMQVARKNVTSDPFVIYGFYSLLEAEVTRLGIADRPECFWNLDESGFPTDSSRWKTIGPVGSKTVRVSCGANRENTTVLAVCCANGAALDPLIVFKGKNLMSNWRGDAVLPNTYYAVSDSGWMTTGIFHGWFEKFVQVTKDTRPLLLLFDGHLTHTSAATIELALKENISLIKLPAHCTDVLQPLDVACFNPLKSYYEKELTERVHQTGAREPLRKAAFGNLISKIWPLGLSEANVKSGFRATGIYPVSASKYKTERLDKVKLRTYNHWVAAGKPVKEDGSPLLSNLLANDEGAGAENQEIGAIPFTPAESLPSTSFATPSTSSQASTPKGNAQRSLTFSPLNVPSANDVPTPQSLINELQQFAPPGMHYSVTLMQQEDETTFEAVIKSRGRPSTTLSQPQKRHRISMHGAVLTDKEFLQQQKNKEQQKKKKVREVVPDADSDIDSPTEMQSDAQEKENPKKKEQRSKTVVESDSDIDSHSERQSSSDSTGDLSDVDDTNMQTLKTTVRSALCRKKLTKELPNPREIEKDSFYAVYWEKPSTYYWGKVEKVFREEEESDVNEVEMKFLKRAVPSSTPSALRWDWPKDNDIDVVNVSRILAGPTKPHIEDKLRGKQYYYFTEEAQVSERFKNVVKFGFPSKKAKR